MVAGRRGYLQNAPKNLLSLFLILASNGCPQLTEFSSSQLFYRWIRGGLPRRCLFHESSRCGVSCSFFFVVGVVGVFFFVPALLFPLLLLLLFLSLSMLFSFCPRLCLHFYFSRRRRLSQFFPLLILFPRLLPASKTVTSAVISSVLCSSRHQKPHVIRFRHLETSRKKFNTLARR